ncbi:MAG: threonylcarbamoyl-AMP synthase [Lachnospiraceae bacterium]|nr:threonylcarbamoyl-AMP synthase [Lachnospiraceae bacterium]
MNSEMDLDLVIKTLKEDGKVVALKTDTVYGLICNAFDKKSTDKIYHIKNRENKKPLSIFLKSINEVKKYVADENLTSYVKRIMEKYWPGALTIVFKKKDSTFDGITSGLSSIGIRIPNDKNILYILNHVNFPLAQTSCNISGEKEYSNANEIKDKLGNSIDLIVDGGEVKNNMPSTILSVECNEPIILRDGAIKLDV